MALSIKDLADRAGLQPGSGNGGGGLGSLVSLPGRTISGIGSLGEEPQTTTDQRNALIGQSDAASNFANTSQGNFGSLGVEAYDLRKRLQDQMAGRNLVSAEQLRQGLQQNLAAQRSIAASAAPRDAAMAARTAAIQGGRLGYGMSGQAALAGMQEANSARDALANMILQQRAQELQGALQGRANAINALTGQPAGKSTLEQYAPLINAGIGAFSGGLGGGGKK